MGLSIYNQIFVMLVYAVCSNAAPYPKKLVDMSYALDNNTHHHPMHKQFRINVVLNGTYPGTDMWVQAEEINLATHTGTHMDAPCHFLKGGMTIDEIPVEKIFAINAAVVDIEEQSEADPNYLLTVEDLEKWEEKTGQQLNDVVIFMKSGWGKKWGNDREFYGTPGDDANNLRFPGMSREAAEWIVANRNVYGVGTETLSIDSGNTVDYPAHNVLHAANIYALENVANVDKLPLFGAKVFIFPMNIAKASGAPTRIIATYPIVIHS